jgi:hypothetical protein
VSAEHWARLAEQLGPRRPEFTEERWLEPGTIAWDVEWLPRVFVAPDVFAALKTRIAVRGEGSQHDLPSRTAEADAAIGHAETLCCAEVAPLGGGIRGDTSEGEQ